MAGFIVWLALAAVLYGSVLTRLVSNWGTDPTYSHGFLVVPIALWLAWRQRERWQSTAFAPANSGFCLVLLGLGLFVVGTLGAELFLTRASLIPVLAGTIAFVFGWQRLRVVLLPILFLIFMVPLPAIVFDRVAVTLQLAASGLGERLLQAADVPVFRDGNLLRLASGTLDVNEACSGIRSIVALVMTGTLVGALAETSAWKRIAVVAASVPLAVVLNGARVAVTGLAVTRFGIGAAQGMVHSATGWIVFVGALIGLWAVHRALGVAIPANRAPIEAS